MNVTITILLTINKQILKCTQFCCFCYNGAKTQHSACWIKKKCKKVIPNIFLLTKLNWTQNQQLEKDWFERAVHYAVFCDVFILQVDIAMTIKKTIYCAALIPVWLSASDAKRWTGLGHSHTQPAWTRKPRLWYVELKWLLLLVKKL